MEPSQPWTIRECSLGAVQRTRGSAVAPSRTIPAALLNETTFMLLSIFSWPFSGEKGIMECSYLRLSRYAEKHRFLPRLLPASTFMLTSIYFVSFPFLQRICRLGRPEVYMWNRTMPLYGVMWSRQQVLWRRERWAWGKWKGFLEWEVWMWAGLKRLGPRKENGHSSGKGALHTGFGDSENPARVEESIVETKEVWKRQSWGG